MAVIIGMKFFGGVSPIALPPSHPYAIDFAGWHVVTNGKMYLSWMCQALLPFENRVILNIQAKMNSLAWPPKP
ncbi:hypothetical protein D4R89_13225 [bacterium]|nr:MAG: hypothetical protein D4R89_13225 [bacterium]